MKGEKMYFFIRRNFNFLTKLLFIFSIISMLYGSFEYSKAKKTIEKIKFSEKYDNEKNKTKDLKIKEKYLKNYDFVKLMDTEPTSDTDFTSLNRKYWECALKKNDEVFEKVEKECLENLKGEENTVKVKNVDIKFNTKNTVLTLKKSDIEVQIKDGKVFYKGILVPLSEYESFIDENGIKEEFFEKISDFVVKYNSDYIPVSEREKIYKNNVKNNFNYNGWKVK
jgi:hypothetical protein